MRVHALDLPSATQALLDAGPKLSCTYACCSNAGSILLARRDAPYREILNGAALNMPDSVPLVGLARLAGYRRVHRAQGTNLMQSTCNATTDGSRTHFFYGGAPGTATELADRLLKRFPGILIAGSHSPLAERAVEDRPLNAVALAQPGFVWVGLPSPDQELFMQRLAASEIQFGVAIGVSNAFDFITGRVRAAPFALQRSGLEWLWPTPTREPDGDAVPSS
ncbi:MAG: WecB/TagA/CpsF family glycosyltransferase [Candidatus Synoicihabitans palmerolidicus]|nr:WecB/TagA/CpsF family glycosyltransferase [Candidatus Synoicihabitans palmerolidicus]